MAHGEATSSHEGRLAKRISLNPQVCFGKPCVKGTRIWVSLILDFLADGTSYAEILEDYPQLSQDDILACVAYGAEYAYAPEPRPSSALLPPETSGEE